MLSHSEHGHGGSSSGPVPAKLSYDGVQFMIKLTKTLRKEFPRPFLLSHAPQTPYLTMSAYLMGLSKDPLALLTGDAQVFFGSYMAIMAAVGDHIDFLNVQAYNNAPATGCPNSAILLNNLVTGPVFPSPLPGYNVTMPPLDPRKLVLGQQVPPVPGDEGPPPSRLPTTDPWCSGTSTHLHRDIGLMYWLNNPTPSSDSVAKASVDLWYPPSQQRGALSPRNRVVYYTNGCDAYNVPTTGYSRSNTIIIGFIYPLSSAPAGAVASPGAVAASLPPWASFGFYYACAVPGGNPVVLGGHAAGAILKAWREVEPGKRKIMVGVGGAAYVPPYYLWNLGDNVKEVARGLRVFFREFAAANHVTLDGIDIDYEDSHALATQMPWALDTPSPGAPTLAGTGLTQRRQALGARPVPALPLYATVGGAFALAVMSAVVLTVILWAAVPSARVTTLGTPGGAAAWGVLAILSAVGIALLSADVERPARH